jgi:25S rRNA (adenine2142-N1)-methyltransferase
VLVEWLGGVLRGISGGKGAGAADGRELRILEVGALSVDNALNLPGKTAVRRIDLRSNAAGIEEQDFMKLPVDVPWRGSERYDVLSLSLVVNFVGDGKGRGEMLRRTTQFLRHETKGEGEGEEAKMLLPALFLVLPLPCVDNSRYLDEERLEEIMEVLGYEETYVKRTNKLYYSLWQYDAARQQAKIPEHLSKKQELRSGSDRNNFCITIG